MNKKAIALALCISLAAAAFAGCKLDAQDHNDQAPQVINPEVTITQQEKEEANMISVSGSGEVKLTPDIAKVTIEVRTENEDAAKAQAENSAAMDAVMQAIMAAGVAENDITTSNVGLDERYNYDRSPAVIVGYYMTNSIDVTIRDIDSVGRVISDAISAGATSTYGLSLSVADSSGAYQNALKAAILDAQGKAEAIAAALGVKLEPIPASIKETSNSYTPNMDYMPMEANEIADEAAAVEGVSIAAGELSISARVNVDYTIDRGE